MDPELRKLIADWWPMRHDGFGARLTLRSLIRAAKRQSGQTLVEIAVALAIVAILVVCVLLFAMNT